jgi:hypothetical protein
VASPVVLRFGIIKRSYPAKSSFLMKAYSYQDFALMKKSNTKSRAFLDRGGSTARVGADGAVPSHFSKAPSFLNGTVHASGTPHCDSRGGIF